VTAPADGGGRRTRTFAWDTVSFDLPGNWDLAEYRIHQRATHVEFEDEFAVRMRGEWVRPEQRASIEKIRERFSKESDRLGKEATASDSVSVQEVGWTAVRHTMPDDVRVVNAFYLGVDTGIFATFQIYFHPQDAESSADITRELANTFRVRNDEARRWKVYDVDLELPADFRLLSTAFNAGRKEFLFHWRLRKLFVWYCSPAEFILRDDREPVEWATEFLTNMGNIKGPTISSEDDRIVCRRARRYVLGHFEEIGRACFKYVAGVSHDPAANQLRVWLYNYRRASDLDRLPADLRDELGDAP
jgi:hypothetical protein